MAIVWSMDHSLPYPVQWHEPLHGTSGEIIFTISYTRFLISWTSFQTEIVAAVQSLSMFDSLQPHVLQHARLPDSSPSPGACSHSCPSSQWCHPTISSPVTPFFPVLIFPSIRVFPNEPALHIRGPKYWDFRNKQRYWTVRTGMIWVCKY